MLNDVKLRKRIGKTEEVILFTLAGAGLFVLNPLAPLGLLSFLFMDSTGRNRSDRKYQTRSVLSKLVKDGLIEIKETAKSKKYFRLTNEGHLILARLRLSNYAIKRPKKWDGKWRVVAFDIKELKRGYRDLLRRELENLGFKKLQNSVWVYPYDCEEIVALIKTGFSLGSDVVYMLVEHIENDIELRRHFNVS